MKKIKGGERKETSKEVEREEGSEGPEEEVHSACCANTPWCPAVAVMKLQHDRDRERKPKKSYNS